jgi:hypothetical protein
LTDSSSVTRAAAGTFEEDLVVLARQFLRHHGAVIDREQIAPRVEGDAVPGVEPAGIDDFIGALVGHPDVAGLFRDVHYAVVALRLHERTARHLLRPVRRAAAAAANQAQQ